MQVSYNSVFQSSTPFDFNQSISSYFKQISSLDSDSDTILNKFKDYIHHKILADKTSFSDICAYLKIDLSLDSLCGRGVNEGEIYFRCLDCDKIGGKEWNHSVYALQCRDCYEKSNHKGHRVVQRTSSGKAVCDCGDIGAWVKEGFCTAHSGYSEERAAKIMEMIPKELAEVFISTFVEAFYNVFSWYEDLRYHEIKYEEEMNQQRTYLDMIFEKILTTLQEFISVHVAFKLLLSKVFQSKLPSHWKLRHKCAECSKTELQDVPVECKCSILETMLRHIADFDKQIQVTLRTILIELFPDYIFKIFLTVVYGKMIGRLFPIEDGVNDQGNQALIVKESELSILSTQLLITDTLSLEIIQSKYSDNFKTATIEILRSFGIEKWHQIIENFQDLTANIVYLSEQLIPCQELLLRHSFIESIIEILQEIDQRRGPIFDEDAIKVWYPGVMQSLSHVFLVQARGLEIFENTMKALVVLQSDNEKEAVMKKIAKLYIENFKILKVQEKLQGHRLVITSSIVRSLALFISYGLGQFPNKQNIRAFFDKYFVFKDNEEQQEFLKYFMRKTAFAIAYYFQLRIAINDFIMPPIKYEIEKSYIYYLFPQYRCFDTDLFLLQVLGLVNEHVSLFSVFLEVMDFPFFQRSAEKKAGS